MGDCTEMFALITGEQIQGCSEEEIRRGTNETAGAADDGCLET